ncbi:DedA family protein [Planotetraspora thailandica]|uniref:DedA family protein n=1 Tax=Planotetraspora thailandica TaxID=487172 RepID=UPI00194E3442|nr:VTT domain-containing protein [Planotetraspora thailandica]
MSTATPAALSAAVNLLDPTSLLQAFGVAGVAATLFAETGLLVGFFLPGDSLLFLAGIAASPVARDIVGVRLSLPLLLLVAPLSAIIGAQLGHHLGARFGRRLFARPDSRLFKSAHVARAETYFDRYGPAKAVVLARFVPVVRTLLNPVAGVLQMPFGRFLRWNIVGGLLWTDAVLLAGYLAAGTLRDAVGAQNIDRYLLPVIALIVLVSLTPLFIEVLRHRRGGRTAEETESGVINGGRR